MTVSQAKSSTAGATVTPGNAGFVLGANWHRPEPSASAPAPHLPGRAVDIFQGIITHYVEPERRSHLKEPADRVRLTEDLGLDSLDMMEVMLRVEDLLNVQVSDHELRQFRTLGEVRQFIERRSQVPATTLPPG